ncbi:MAG TPA: ABC transporter ATP-binding protein [Polyangiaceae bacterium]|nr:ABC transporter ATP-binding protein [Polyangiaceae bacterium]
MIEVEHLTKNYGPVAALRSVSFQVGRGEVVGFVGPNGAGKSTTLRILTGYIGATSGSVRIAGHDILREPLRARSQLGYMPETAPLYPEMRVNEYLRFRARLKRVSSKEERQAVGRAMQQAGVHHVENTLVGHLSKGYRQRVALADALVSDPPLLILDEPTAGLDPNQIREVRALIKSLSSTRTILLSTHILSEVEATCDRALVIHRGKLVLEGPLATLRDEELRAVLRVRDPEARAREIVASIDAVAAADMLGTEGKLSVLAVRLKRKERARSFERVVEALVRAGVGVQSLTPEKPRLEDIFSELTESPGPPQHEGPAA